MTPRKQRAEIVERVGRFNTRATSKEWSLVAGVATLLFGAAATAVWRCGERRSLHHTEAVRAGLDAGRIATTPTLYDPRELNGLPQPVQRYFRAALEPGQTMLSTVDLAQAGEFNLSEGGDQWKPFTATQRIVLQRPGFDWHARIRYVPLLSVHVNDTYLDGQGSLRAALAGVVTLADIGGTPEMAQGELMRFLAEAAWYPTALLPSQGVRWQAVDDRSALATIHDGRTRATLLFRFNPAGLVDSVRAGARGRAQGSATVPTPWEGRWWAWAQRHGMQVPLEGEAAWLLPGGTKPYWRGRVTHIEYDRAAR